MVKFKVNGVKRSFDGDPEMPLLWYLRDVLGLTGTKFGCGIALCGSCTVHQDGKAVRSCTTPLNRVAGTETRTIEDPLEYLLDLIGSPRVFNPKETAPGSSAPPEGYAWDIGRLRRVIEVAAENAGWGKRKMSKGSGLGIAAHRGFLTYVATVVEVEVNDQGEVRIPRVDTAIDAGLVVNPELTRSQFEGAAVFGTSIVRGCEIKRKMARSSSRTSATIPWPESPRPPTKRMCTSSTVTRHRPESANRVSHSSHQQSVMRSSPRPASESGNCRSRATILWREVRWRPPNNNF